MNFFKLLLLTLTLTLAAPAPAPAFLDNLFQKQDNATLPQDQKYYIFDDASFTQNTKSYHQIPFNNPKLEFDIILPKDWVASVIHQDSTLSLGQKILVDSAKFKSPMIGTAQPVVTIQSTNLTDEISAENWLKNYIFTNGYSLQEKITSFGNKKAATSFISVFEGKSTYTYIVVQINGNIAAMARFEIPLALKDALGFLQRKSIDSFRLIVVTEEPVETQKVYSISDVLKFTYPESWTIYFPDFRNSQRLSVQIHNQSQTKKIEGLISFLAVQRGFHTSLQKEIEEMKKYFSDTMEIDFKSLTSSSKGNTYSRVLFSRYEVYQVTSKKNTAFEQELRLVVLGDKEWYFFIFLLTPTESNNLYTWASNMQTFDLIIKNLK